MAKKKTTEKKAAKKKRKKRKKKQTSHGLMGKAIGARALMAFLLSISHFSVWYPFQGWLDKKENIVQQLATRCFPEGRKFYIYRCLLSATGVLLLQLRW